MSDQPQEFDPMLQEPQVLFLHANPLKRIVSCGMLYALAGLLGSVLVIQPPRDLVWVAFLAVMVAATAWLGWRTQVATRGWLELRSDGLYRNTGAVVCKLEDVASVSRGVFAFKPSNGFLLRLKASGSRCWNPGLYWQLGSFLGVGGATSKAQADVMSETIALVLERRDAT